ncbi:hypothetical protein [uncultured Clostridium sp.]|uniref:hypothetical protein n=1 Tax=uncultured Clostridium sp. TaxID=59620 RepID=UPI0026DCAD29|nr:hypothetical protein [uncultured Clostridium sp.]
MKKQWTNLELKKLMLEDTLTNCSIVESSTLVLGKETMRYYCKTHNVYLSNENEVMQHLMNSEDHNLSPSNS